MRYTDTLGVHCNMSFPQLQVHRVHKLQRSQSRSTFKQLPILCITYDWWNKTLRIYLRSPPVDTIDVQETHYFTYCGLVHHSLEETIGQHELWSTRLRYFFGQPSIIYSVMKLFSVLIIRHNPLPFPVFREVSNLPDVETDVITTWSLGFPAGYFKASRLYCRFICISAFNSLMPNDAYMGQYTNQHWFR